jgi:hypothetical protein
MVKKIETTDGLKKPVLAEDAALTTVDDLGDALTFGGVPTVRTTSKVSH